MAKSDLLKEAIADAKAVKETALANAKIALQEAFAPRLERMLATKLTNEIEGEEDADAMDDEEEDDEQDATALKARWNRLVTKEMASCRGDRMKASQKVNKRYPGLRSAMVEADNRERASRRTASVR